MLKQIVLVCGIALLQQYNLAGAIECYSCTNATSLPECKATIKCPTDAACASEYTMVNGTRIYNLGCRDLLACPLISTVTPGSSSIIGRSATTSANCSECCHSNFCNRQICQDADPHCADDKSFNCATVGAITSICDDASHIRPYCRRFCGFCNTIDGGWAHWSQWSKCSVTCGNGTRDRSRACSDPPPANGGNDCPGVTHEQDTCAKDLCPIHGGWGSWSRWCSCSASCDIGLQHRERTCSNPYPARNGNHCFGDSREDKLCFPGACSNGAWSSWGYWGACTTSCGGGVKTRSRNCNNPTPSMTGKNCAGNPIQAVSCNTSSCHVVGFSVKVIKNVSASGVMTFNYTDTNADNSYNETTGIFTCKTSGYYYISASLMKDHDYDGSAFCYIYKNDYHTVQAFTYPGVSSHTGNTAAVISTYLHLNAGDTVKLAKCTKTASWDTRYVTSSFSGYLVTSDA